MSDSIRDVERETMAHLIEYFKREGKRKGEKRRAGDESREEMRAERRG
jgi:hypothetical protein